VAAPLVEVLHRVLGRGEKIGVSFGTNASRISVANVPTVVFGPGSIDQAHTADEWLSLDELAKASDVLYEYARQ
jgi:acetylornithine deacetylase/succinyl-diaminopimelate desuccinylase-like protein